MEIDVPANQRVDMTHDRQLSHVVAEMAWICERFVEGLLSLFQTRLVN